MNILIDVSPQSVIIDNVEYEINSNFRTSILYELLIQDYDLKDEEKVIQALQLYYPVIPENIEGAIDKILWFYRCGKNIENSKSHNDTETTGSNNIYYSFEYDAEYIYSAFLDQYGIDLQDIEYLHWWKFKAMFKSLKEDNEIVKIMGYRATKITKDMSKEQKDFYKNMKKIYKLPTISKEDENKFKDLNDALMGENLEGLKKLL